MIELHLELMHLAFVLIFALLLSHVVVPKMKKEMKDFTWDQYFKKCGIYQGTSHWTTIKSILLKLSRWTKIVKQKIVFSYYFLLMALSSLKHSSHKVFPKGIVLPHLLHLPCFTCLKPKMISWFLVVHLNNSLSLCTRGFILLPH